MLDDELIEIIRIKEFNNVWSTLQYLIDIGCSEKEILWILPKFFTESDYFNRVAYARILGMVKHQDNHNGIEDVEWVMFVGMIDETNYKLMGMFNSYKLAASENKIYNNEQNDLDGFCQEKYEFKNLSDKILDYFRDVAIKYYGYSLDNWDNKIKN